MERHGRRGDPIVIMVELENPETDIGPHGDGEKYGSPAPVVVELLTQDRVHSNDMITAEIPFGDRLLNNMGKTETGIQPTLYVSNDVALKMNRPSYSKADASQNVLDRIKDSKNPKEVIVHRLEEMFHNEDSAVVVHIISKQLMDELGESWRNSDYVYSYEPDKRGENWREEYRAFRGEISQLSFRHQAMDLNYAYEVEMILEEGVDMSG